MAQYRILEVPAAESLLEARLDALCEEAGEATSDLVLDYGAFCLAGPPCWSTCDGRPCEAVEGHYLPRRLRFRGVRSLERTGLYAHLEAVPPDHAARRLLGLLAWRTPEAGNRYLLIHASSDEPARLFFSARDCVLEERAGLARPAAFVRDSASPPPLPARSIPEPKKLHRQYAGDPVTIRLGRRTYHRRLFVGGIDLQGAQRPEVGTVLNLSEEPNPWAVNGPPHPADRWSCKGEGRRGMNVAEITVEAQWVIEQLRASRRVLVHCQAGFNRSVTICCAVLILLEQLTAEAALERVREHHPWARPDAHHWLMLRWLADHPAS